MAQRSDLAKSLKIKGAACQRLSKEVLSYHKEVVKDQQRLDEKRAAGADAYDLKQLETVLEESKQMIAECTKRLSVAATDLELILNEAKNLSSLPVEELQVAETALKQAKEQLVE